MQGFPVITFTDPSDEQLAQVIKVTDGGYYGGNTRGFRVFPASGNTAAWLTGDELLAAIAQLPTGDPASQITITSDENEGTAAVLAMSVRSDFLAAVLGMTEEQIASYFAHIVWLAPPAPAE